MKLKQIKVIGDIMLDSWEDGNFEKKSAEAPINIFQSKKIKYSLGGVGNLSVNLKSLKNKPYPVNRYRQRYYWKQNN